MTALHVVDCGPAVSVQDAGRFGFRRYGVSTAGAMDHHSLAVANALVGNPPGAAAVEVALSGARFRVCGGPVLVAAFGAGTTMEVSARRVAHATSVMAKPNDEIVVRPSRAGVYAYLAVAGGVLTQSDLGSRSCHWRSGLGGQPLAKGAEIPCEPARADLRALHYTVTSDSTRAPFRLVSGPQEAMFAPDTLERFFSTPYRISRQSDRMGLRLEGALLPALDGHDIVSDGVVPGSVQVPGDGLPIVLMRDCQTTGGYPKIATIISADLDRLSQVPPGEEIRLVPVSVEQAQEAAHSAAQTIAAIPKFLQQIPETRRNLLSQNLIGGVTRGDDP